MEVRVHVGSYDFNLHLVVIVVTGDQSTLGKFSLFVHLNVSSERTHQNGGAVRGNSARSKCRAPPHVGRGLVFAESSLITILI